MAICARAAKLPSIASLGCLPWEGHVFQGRLLRTKDCCVQMRDRVPPLLQGCLAGSSAQRPSQFDWLGGLERDGCERKDTMESRKSGWSAELAALLFYFHCPNSKLLLYRIIITQDTTLVHLEKAQVGLQGFLGAIERPAVRPRTPLPSCPQ